MRYAALLACVGLSLTSPAYGQQPVRPLAERLTIAFGDSAGGCISTSDSLASTGAAATLLLPPTTQAGAGDGHVLRVRLGKRLKDCAFEGMPGYAIVGAKLEGYARYLVVLGETGRARILNGRIEIDLTGDSKPESVRVCTSMEGLHFSIWAGVPFKSRRLEHLYAPLGYDVEPSCRKAEWQLDG